MIRVLLAAALTAALTLPASGASGDIVSRLARKPQTAYRGEQIIATWDGRRAQATLVRVEHEPPDRTRLEYVSIGAPSRRVVLRRGPDEVEFDPDRLVGTQRRRLPAEDDDLETTHLAWLRSNYTVTSAQDHLLGRPVERIELRPRTPDRPSRTLFLDAATGVVLRSERRSPDGRLGEVTVFISFEPVPSGAHIVQNLPANLRLAVERGPRPLAAADAARLAGRSLIGFRPPGGFHPVALYLAADAPPTFQSVYSDGLETLVLTQRVGSNPQPPGSSRMVDAGGGPVWIHSMGLRTLSYWASSGWLLTLVGDVTPESMLSTAEDTGVAPPPRLLDRLIDWLARLRR